jgi:adenine-specific DNA-methyltransferase
MPQNGGGRYLDEVFGQENYKNEISWKRTSAHANVSQRYGMIHDVIFYYTKSDKFTWNQQHTNYEEEYLKTFFDQTDEKGKRYARRDLTAGMDRASRGQIYSWRGITPPPTRCWAMTIDKMDELEAQGKIHWPKKTGGMPRLKLYPDDLPGIPLQDMWTDISPLHNLAQERVGYPTQKPESFLERFIQTSSNPGDLVLDCFCGSGTTAAVAEKLGRRWITCDLGRFAIHTARKRLLGITGVKPFVVQNLGKYERQAWQAAEFENVQDAAAREARYRAFILELYRAQPSSGAWLHGIKGGRMVHVGPVDAPITLSDVKAVARETLKLVGTGEGAPETAGADILGWDFAFELNEMGLQIAADAGVNVKFKKIPREVLEKKAVDQGDIKFFELAALTLASSVKGRTANLELRDFIISPDDVPADVMQKITHWSQWVDYWAVDWNYREDTFHNEWQAYRTRKQPKLEVKAAHVYEMPGVYTVLVKVIDLLGNDTTKAVRLEVK